MSDSLVISPLNQIPTELLTSSENRLESRIQSIRETSGENRKNELKNAAEEFEAIFIAYMLKVMRETIEESGLMGGGFGKTIYTELFDQEVSINLARRGALGISDLLYKNLEKMVDGKESDASRSTSNPSGSLGEEVHGISDLQLPVHAPVSSGFGMRKDPFTYQSKFHRGIDFAAPEGMKVVAALSGKVLSAGYERGYGNTVLIQHADGVQTRYGHLGDINVKAGDSVSSENTIGTVGSTGRSTGPHLHFEVIRDGRKINPILSYNSGDTPAGSDSAI